MINHGRKETRHIQRDVVNALLNGKTLMTYKTKRGVGRKSVTVGRYRKAVGPNGYAVIVGADIAEFSSAISAAQDFIEYVGRNDAYDALMGRGRERNPA